MHLLYNCYSHFTLIFAIVCLLDHVTCSGDLPDLNDHDDYDYDYDYAHAPTSPGHKISEYLRQLYAANKHLPVVKQVSSLNTTMLVIDHLVNLTENILFKQLDLSANQPNERSILVTAMLDVFYEANLSDDCLWSLGRVLRAVQHKQIWAMKFLDAFGKLPTGIAEGSISHFGEYDECLEIEHREQGQQVIHGRYCLAKWILPYPVKQSSSPVQFNMSGLYGREHYDYIQHFLKLYNLDNYLTLNKWVEKLNNQHGATVRLGVCFPAQCSAHEFEELLNMVLHPVTRLPIELEPDCYDVQSTRSPYDRYEMTAITMLTLMLVVNVLCTIYHIYLRYFPHPARCALLRECVLCFSLLHNTSALFNLSAVGGAGLKHRFQCIDVIGLFLVLNICIDHMFLFPPFMTFMAFKRTLNSVITKVYYYNKYFFARNIMVIDALVIIRGLLLSYTLLRKLKLGTGHHQLSYWLLLPIRLWLKYSWPMLFVVQLYWLLPRTGDGPIWKLGMSMLIPACKEPDSLLSSFLYVSNYRIKANQNVFNFDQRFALCNPPTWFLSALFQLQLLGPMFVFALHRNPTIGLVLNVGVVLFGCYASIFPDLIFGQKTYFESATFSSLEEMTKAFVAFHMGINQYLISFFIGIIIGYLIIRKQTSSLNTSATNPTTNPSTNPGTTPSYRKWLLWTVSIIGLCVVMYWFNTLHRINEAPARHSVLLWFSLGKLIGGICIGWMLYELCIGQAVIIERIFSLSMFRVLSRLSFGIYLLHFLPLANRLFTVRDTYVMTDKLLFEFILVHFIQTGIMASIFYVTIERPFNHLTLILFEKIHCQTSPSTGAVSCVDENVSGKGNVCGGACGGASEGSLPSNAVNVSSSQSSSSLHHKMIRIEIQETRLCLPKIDLYAANCGDFQH